MRRLEVCGLCAHFEVECGHCYQCGFHAVERPKPGTKCWTLYNVDDPEMRARYEALELPEECVLKELQLAAWEAERRGACGSIPPRNSTGA